MALPKRFFGGVDPVAAQAAVDEQRRHVAELTEHLARVEGQLAQVRAERDAAHARLRELEGQITDVLRLATRAAQETEAETAARVAEATEQAQKRVDDLAVQAAKAAETARSLAEALADAVERYEALAPIEVGAEPTQAPPGAPPEVVAAAVQAGDPPEVVAAAVQAAEPPGVVAAAVQAVEPPEEPFLEAAPEPAARTEAPIETFEPAAPEPEVAPAAVDLGVVEEEPEPAQPEPAEQPPTYTTVLARPLPSPAAAVDVEQRLVRLPGVREVTLQKLGSAEAEFQVAHDPGQLDLGPLTQVGVPVTVVR